ncbi:hypothetical protein COV16_03960 [Candidatus Woesearchaeota archaeon CG10_big_fil_rev_8_21_14_0_10_34_8]|nr:MAG: hypothetical protein COV16_03960 [Candidatus Woesearchaeota archaeon CG10_big_fil_rev_8_21_14_0_10_34_8]
MKKIDIHAHITNRPVEGIIYPNASLNVLQEEMEKYNIEKTVLLATYFPHRGTGITNFRLLDWINEDGWQEFSLFGSLDFEKYFYQGYNELEELAERGKIGGIKIYTSYQHIDLQGENFSQVRKLAGKHNLPLMFHMGYTHTGIKNKPFIAEKVTPSDIEFVAEYGQKIIMCHLAKPFTEELIQVVKRNETIYADMSGLIDSYRDKHELPQAVKLVEKVLGECGPDKLLFGTDFPVQTHKDSVYMIKSAMKDYSYEDKQKVYYDNAKGIILDNKREMISPPQYYYNGRASCYELDDDYDDLCEDD